MTIVTITSNRKPTPRSNEGFGPCCGLPPEVCEWKRRRKTQLTYVLVECTNPECENRGDNGVFDSLSDIHAKWDRYRRKVTQ